MEFHQLALHEVPWNDLEHSPDGNLFQTREWLEFLSVTQNATPVVAQIENGSSGGGFFVGLKLRKFGVPILASPMPGWTTPYMGFSMTNGISRYAALLALRDFAFNKLGCWQVELTDRAVTEEDAQRAGYVTSWEQTYFTDLTPPEPELFRRMHQSVRKNIRKAERCGVAVEEATDAHFAEDYYSQLEDVFARQGLVPTYSLGRVQELIKRLSPTGRLLLLRALEPGGRCIATDICFGRGDVAFIFGNASYRAYQHLRPNQLLHWRAFLYWKARGARVFDWMGGRDYKEKYAGVLSRSVACRASRFSLLEHLRTTARFAHRTRQLIVGSLHSKHLESARNFEGSDTVSGV